MPGDQSGNEDSECVTPGTTKASKTIGLRDEPPWPAVPTRVHSEPSTRDRMSADPTISSMSGDRDIFGSTYQRRGSLALKCRHWFCQEPVHTASTADCAPPHRFAALRDQFCANRLVGNQPEPRLSDKSPGGRRMTSWNVIEIWIALNFGYILVHSSGYFLASRK